MKEVTVLEDELLFETSLYEEVVVVVLVVVPAALFVSLADEPVLEPPLPELPPVVLVAADVLADVDALSLAD